MVSPYLYISIYIDIYISIFYVVLFTYLHEIGGDRRT